MWSSTEDWSLVLKIKPSHQILFNLQPFLNKFCLTFDMKIVSIFLYQTKTKFAGDWVRLKKYTISYLEAHNCESRELAILSDFDMKIVKTLQIEVIFCIKQKQNLQAQGIESDWPQNKPEVTWRLAINAKGKVPQWTSCFITVRDGSWTTTIRHKKQMLNKLNIQNI